MARIDKGLIILVGRDRENPRTHRDAFQITGGLGEVLDKHIKRNNLNKSEFIREAIAAKLEAEMPKEPLIKDKKIRKAVRLCADIWGANKILVIKSGSRIEFSDGTPNMRYVSFMYAEWQDEIKDRTYYTVEELCGEEEAPEPLEPKFIDLDERVKEKEKKPRPVIANGVEYDSYADYLKSREEEE